MDAAEPAPFQASVVTLGIPGFARRPVAEQARLRAQLETGLAVVFADWAADERIVLDAPDGVVVLALRSPLKALQLAERMAAARGAGLALAIAINHGPVRIAEEGGATRVSGDGVATGAVVAGFAAPSGLLLTRAFRDALAAEEPGRTGALRAAGVFTDAGLRAHDVFVPDAARGARRRRWIGAAGVLVLTATLAASIAYRAAVADRARPLAGALGAIERLAAAGGAGARALAARIGW